MTYYNDLGLPEIQPDLEANEGDEPISFTVNMAQDEDGVMRGTVTDDNQNSVNVVIPAKDDVAKN